MNKHYLQLDFKTGRFFEYSSKEKEGYEEYTSAKGVVSYRKYYNFIEGVLESASVRDGNFGQQVSLTFKSDGDIYYTPIDLYSQKGRIATYAESLIKYLPYLEKGETYVFRGYNFIPDGDKYAKIGISIKKDGDKVEVLSNAYYKEGDLVEGDIPAIVWKKDALGKSSPTAVSVEEKENYLKEVLVKGMEKLSYKSESNYSKDDHKNPTKKTETKPTKKAKKEEEHKVEEVEVEVEDDDDDLPF